MDAFEVYSKIIEKSELYWKAAYEVIEDQKKYESYDEDGHTSSYEIDQRYILKANKKCAWLHDKVKKYACANQPITRKNKYPYMKLLESYLKLAVLK